MRSLRFAALACLAVLGFLAACGDKPGPSEPPDASVPETCTEAGTELCDGSCVSTGRDPEHCGGCGKACAAGAGCEGGVCIALCQIDGKQVTEGTVNAANACEQCTPETSSTAWTPRADGTSCNPGQVCAAGACASRCFIEGALYAEGTPNPANACEVCRPAASTAQWTARESIPLLTGGTDISTQGWTTVAQTPNTLSYGEDYVRLATSTDSAGRTSGQLLLVRTNAFDATKPFSLRATLQVESVNRHNALDSGAAILGSFTLPFGQTLDRSQMLYLDSAAIGWADDTQSAAFSVTDGAYHVYELAVDAAKVATVRIDGVAKLTRSNFTANGTIAIGDQTNDPNVDGVMRLKSVELLCP
jgi:predicted small lipoprotein YifL